MRRLGLPRKERPLSGPQHYWDRMRTLTAELGGFTVGDIFGSTNGVSRKTVRLYISACLSGKYIEGTSHRKIRGNHDAVVYRVKVTAAEAPCVRAASYADRGGRGREQLWTAIRAMPYFRVRDLAISASTDDVSISVRKAREYVLALRRAGYLLDVSEGGSTRNLVHRLKPAMNTGPKPPAVCSDGTVIDRNRRAVVDGPASEVSA